MVKIKIFSEGSSIKTVEVSGHAGFAENGFDIVCAGVSAITQSTLLGLTKVLNLNIDYEKKDGLLKFTLPDNLSESQRREADLLLSTMRISIEDLAAEYKKFIKLEVY